MAAHYQDKAMELACDAKEAIFGISNLLRHATDDHAWCAEVERPHLDKALKALDALSALTAQSAPQDERETPFITEVMVHAFHDAVPIISDADEIRAGLRAALSSAQGKQEPIGEMREGGVIWFGQNPHAFPVGTQFFAAPVQQEIILPNSTELETTVQQEAKPEQTAPKVLTVGQRVAAVRALQKYVENYLDDYEYRGDPGDYTPNEQEAELISDCVQGLLSDKEFIQLVATMALPYEQPHFPSQAETQRPCACSGLESGAKCKAGCDDLQAEAQQSKCVYPDCTCDGPEGACDGNPAALSAQDGKGERG